MRNFVFIVALLCCNTQIHAQQFKFRSETTLPDSIVMNSLVWADVNNDAILDLLVTGSRSDSTQFILLYKVEPIAPDTIPVATVVDTIEISVKNLSTYLADVDLDNDMDLFLSGDWEDGPATMLAVNEGNFNFRIQPVVKQSAQILRLVDLDQDGDKELILGQLSDTTSLSVFKRNSSAWRKVKEWPNTNVLSLEVFDFDKDGFNDLFVSGKYVENDSVICHVWYSSGDLSFAFVPLVPSIAGTATVADMDANGYFDVLVAGKNVAGNDSTLLFLNSKDGFTSSRDRLPALQDLTIFAADLNSDGKCDLHFRGRNNHGDWLSLIQYDTTSIDTLNSLTVVDERFGDFDRDGDLDLVRGILTDTVYTLLLFENSQPTKNEPPSSPFNAVGLAIFDRTFLFWEKPSDDHTNYESLTYDLVAQLPGQEWIIGEFDQLSFDRLTVSHGNVGNQNFALLHSAPASITFSVQAVDNSFHAGLKDGGTGVCTGTSVDCTASLEYDSIQVCRNEIVHLNAPSSALWFSFADGFLTQANQLEYSTATPDTVFYFIPGAAAGCSSVKAYTFQISEKLVRSTLSTEYVCEGIPKTFAVENKWEHIEWSSVMKGFISFDSAIVFTPVLNDTLSVTVNDSTGCIIEKHTAFVFSKPDIQLNGETFQIFRGSRVQLSAGGGIEYQWSPSNGLDIASAPDPWASPTSTTTYTVMISDSLGCDAEANVTVIVEVAAFVPNLFTPNDDGKNDELKVFGLERIEGFSFTIHNREGSIVYETNDIQEASSKGWNGTVRGVKQPSGTYYWKVSGLKPTGNKLLLNGKSSGTIVLVR